MQRRRRDGDAATLDCIPFSRVELSVADTGEGMPSEAAQEVVQRAIDPVLAAERRGKDTGRDLCMVQDFVERSGGRLVISTAPGRGTTIRLLFPRREDAADGDRSSQGAGVGEQCPQPGRSERVP